MKTSRILAATLGAALAFAASPARADETSSSAAGKAACVATLDRAQTQQTGRRLRDARTSYLGCSSEVCPAVVREDCARSLAELEASIPTTVFAATLDGADIDDVRVAVDGDVVAEHLDGKAIPVDPGTHVARFIRSGRPTLEVKFVAHEGEKNRQVAAAFGVAHPAKAPEHVEGSKRFPILPLVLAGTGTIALGSALALRLSADSTADDMRKTCAPACDPGARDSLSDKLVMSNVSLAIGVGALAAAAVAWLVDSHH